MAPHEKVYVDSDFAEDENHGELCCHECHGGDPAEADWKKAHEGVVKDPSYPDPSETCGACHDLIAENYQNSLHVTLSPYKKIIGQRAGAGTGDHQIGGALVAEIIFSYPGLGSTILTAVLGQDYPLISAVMLIITIMVLAANFAIEIIYGFLDPRIKSTQS